VVSKTIEDRTSTTNTMRVSGRADYPRWYGTDYGAEYPYPDFTALAKTIAAISAACWPAWRASPW